MHGRCDCDDAPEWGCHYEMYSHVGHEGLAVTPVATPAAETLKALPKEVMPKE
jgi:hypothetical protein